jgi:hypothetical protein
MKGRGIKKVIMPLTPTLSHQGRRGLGSSQCIFLGGKKKVGLSYSEVV